MQVRASSPIRILYRGVAVALSLLLCLPSPDVFAAVGNGKASVFDVRKANHDAVRERNLQLLQQKQSLHNGGAGRAVDTSGQPSAAQGATPAGPIRLSELPNLSALHIPAEDGQVLEVWEPETTYDVGRTSYVQESRPTVLLLQDLHTQPDAQHAEGRIFRHVFERYGVSIVAAEGATGPFELTLAQQFPRDKSLRAQLAETFLTVGEMMGYEYESVVEQLPVTIVGVEDEQLYEQNGDVFRQALNTEPAARQAAERIASALDALKPALYSEAQQQLDRQRQAFHEGGVALADYIRDLLALAETQGIDVQQAAPQIVAVHALQQAEASIDHEQVGKEFQRFLDALNARLEQRGDASLRKTVERLSGLLAAQQISSEYFYEHLLDAAKPLGLLDDTYPALAQFSQLQAQRTLVRPYQLHMELDALEWILMERLASSDDAKQLARHARHAELLESLVSLGLTSEQLTYYQANRQAFRASAFREFLDARLARTEPEFVRGLDGVARQLDEHAALVERFYELALARDVALVENTLALRSSSGESAAGVSGAQSEAVLLVVGGFHTEGVTTLLRERNVSYAVITPVAAGEVDEALYHRLIRGELTPIEQKFEVFASLNGGQSQPTRVARHSAYPSPSSTALSTEDFQYLMTHQTDIMMLAKDALARMPEAEEAARILFGAIRRAIEEEGATASPQAVAENIHRQLENSGRTELLERLAEAVNESDLLGSEFGAVFASVTIEHAEANEAEASGVWEWLVRHHTLLTRISYGVAATLFLAAVVPYIDFSLLSTTKDAADGAALGMGLFTRRQFVKTTGGAFAAGWLSWLFPSRANAQAPRVAPTPSATVQAPDWTQIKGGSQAEIAAEVRYANQQWEALLGRVGPPDSRARLRLLELNEQVNQLAQQIASLSPDSDLRLTARQQLMGVIQDMRQWDQLTGAQRLTHYKTADALAQQLEKAPALQKLAVADDPAEWLLYWRDLFGKYKAFPSSFRPGLINVDPFLLTRAFTYDIAESALHLLYESYTRNDEKYRIAAKEMLVQLADQIQLLPPTPGGLQRGFLHASFDLYNGGRIEPIRTGNMAWAAYAMLEYERLTGEQIRRSPQAGGQLGWELLLNNLISDDVAVSGKIWDADKHAFLGGTDEKGEPDVPWASTEHNVRAYLALLSAMRVTVGAPAGNAYAGLFERYKPFFMKLQEEFLYTNNFFQGDLQNRGGDRANRGWQDPTQSTDPQILMMVVAAGLARYEITDEVYKYVTAPENSFFKTQNLANNSPRAPITGLGLATPAQGVSSQMTMLFALLSKAIGLELVNDPETEMERLRREPFAQFGGQPDGSQMDAPDEFGDIHGDERLFPLKHSAVTAQLLTFWKRLAGMMTDNYFNHRPLETERVTVDDDSVLPGDPVTVRAQVRTQADYPLSGTAQVILTDVNTGEVFMEEAVYGVAGRPAGQPFDLTPQDVPVTFTAKKELEGRTLHVDVVLKIDQNGRPIQVSLAKRSAQQLTVEQSTDVKTKPTPGVTVSTVRVNPNPSSALSKPKVNVTVDQNSKVTVKVYNLGGQFIQELAGRRAVSQGTTATFEWNGENREGRPVATGVYFVVTVIEKADGTVVKQVVKITYISDSLGLQDWNSQMRWVVGPAPEEVRGSAEATAKYYAERLASGAIGNVPDNGQLLNLEEQLQTLVANVAKDAPDAQTAGERIGTQIVEAGLSPLTLQHPGTAVRVMKRNFPTWQVALVLTTALLVVTFGPALYMQYMSLKQVAFQGAMIFPLASLRPGQTFTVPGRAQVTVQAVDDQRGYFEVRIDDLTADDETPLIIHATPLAVIETTLNKSSYRWDLSMNRLPAVPHLHMTHPEGQFACYFSIKERQGGGYELHMSGPTSDSQPIEMTTTAIMTRKEAVDGYALAGTSVDPTDELVVVTGRHRESSLSSVLDRDVIPVDAMRQTQARVQALLSQMSTNQWNALALNASAVVERTVEGLQLRITKTSPDSAGRSDITVEVLGLENPDALQGMRFELVVPRAVTGQSSVLARFTPDWVTQRVAASRGYVSLQGIGQAGTEGRIVFRGVPQKTLARGVLIRAIPWAALALVAFMVVTGVNADAPVPVDAVAGVALGTTTRREFLKTTAAATAAIVTKPLRALAGNTPVSPLEAMQKVQGSTLLQQAASIRAQRDWWQALTGRQREEIIAVRGQMNVWDWTAFEDPRRLQGEKEAAYTIQKALWNWQSLSEEEKAVVRSGVDRISQQMLQAVRRPAALSSVTSTDPHLSYVLSRRADQVDPFPQLLPNWYISYADGHEQVPFFLPDFTHRAWIFDQAEIALHLLEAGRRTGDTALINEAKNLLDAVADQIEEDGKIDFSYNTDTGEHFGQYYTGAMAWVAYALARFEKVTGEAIHGTIAHPVRGWERILTFLSDPANNIIQNVDLGGGVPGTVFRGGVGISWVSTEHNLRMGMLLDLALELELRNGNTAFYTQFAPIASNLERALKSSHMLNTSDPNNVHMWTGYDNFSQSEIVADTQTLAQLYFMGRGEYPLADQLGEYTLNHLVTTQAIYQGNPPGDVTGVAFSTQQLGVLVQMCLQEEISRMARDIRDVPPGDPNPVQVEMEKLLAQFNDGSLPVAPGPYFVLGEEFHMWKHITPTSQLWLLLEYAAGRRGDDYLGHYPVRTVDDITYASSVHQGETLEVAMPIRTRLEDATGTRFIVVLTDTSDPQNPVKVEVEGTYSQAVPVRNLANNQPISDLADGTVTIDTSEIPVGTYSRVEVITVKDHEGRVVETGRSQPGTEPLNVTFPTAVEPGRTPIPTQHSLEQNYPNPFNPSTTVRFTLAKRSSVSLKIFSETGQLVKTLINNEVLNEGPHDWPWDGTNNDGKRVASGVYVAQLVIDGKVVLGRKMIRVAVHDGMKCLFPGRSDSELANVRQEEVDKRVEQLDAETSRQFANNGTISMYAKAVQGTQRGVFAAVVERDEEGVAARDVGEPAASEAEVNPLTDQWYEEGRIVRQAELPNGVGEGWVWAGALRGLVRDEESVDNEEDLPYVRALNDVAGFIAAGRVGEYNVEIVGVNFDDLNRDFAIPAQDDRRPVRVVGRRLEAGEQGVERPTIRVYVPMAFINRISDMNQEFGLGALRSMADAHPGLFELREAICGVGHEVLELAPLGAFRQEALPSGRGSDDRTAGTEHWYVSDYEIIGYEQVEFYGLLLTPRQAAALQRAIFDRDVTVLERLRDTRYEDTFSDEERQRRIAVDPYAYSRSLEQAQFLAIAAHHALEDLRAESAPQQPLRGRSVAELQNHFRGVLGFGLQRMEAISEDYQAQIAPALEGKQSSLSAFKTYIEQPTGEERGALLSVDMGGTNNRVIRIELRENGEFVMTDKANRETFQFGETDKHGTAQDMFQKLAQGVYRLLEREGHGTADTTTLMNIGFVFSFPMNQVAINKAYAGFLTKGFHTVRGLRGREIVEMFQQALNAEGLSNVTVSAVVNDTGGPLAYNTWVRRARAIAQFGQDAWKAVKAAVMGIIAGTGTNKMIDFGGDIGIRNMEDGNFWSASLLAYQTKYDRQLDQESSNAGRQLFEKMVSGKYLGELVRLMVMDVRSRSDLFQGWTLEMFKQDPEDPYKFTTEYLSQIAVGNFAPLEAVVGTLSAEERELLQTMTRLVVRRSARLMAASIVAGLRYVNPELTEEHFIGIDGSLYGKSPNYKAWVNEAIQEMVGPDAAVRIHIEYAEDSTSVGVSVIAARAAAAREAARRKGSPWALMWDLYGARDEGAMTRARAIELSARNRKAEGYSERTLSEEVSILRDIGFMPERGYQLIDAIKALSEEQFELLQSRLIREVPELNQFTIPPEQRAAVAILAQRVLDEVSGRFERERDIDAAIHAKATTYERSIGSADRASGEGNVMTMTASRPTATSFTAGAVGSSASGRIALPHLDGNRSLVVLSEETFEAISLDAYQSLQQDAEVLVFGIQIQSSDILNILRNPAMRGVVLMGLPNHFQGIDTEIVNKLLLDVSKGNVSLALGLTAADIARLIAEQGFADETTFRQRMDAARAAATKA